MLRKLLLFIVVLTAGFLNAQTLYWVGGSGNFNDAHHWSLTSGGVSSSTHPSSTTDLIFDDNSSHNQLVINITGLNTIKSITFKNTQHQYYFVGSNLSSITCSGDFILNEKTVFEASTKLIFSNNSSNYSTVNFWRNTISADVLFEDGNWDLQSVKIADNSLLKINKGNYKVSNTSIVTGNLESAADDVVFQSTHSTFYIKNKITLGNKVNFNSNDLVLIAQKNNPTLYNINPSVGFGANSKIFNTNPNPQACLITYTYTNPSCFGSCDGSITVDFDAGCNTGPYDLIFNNSSLCFPTGTNSISPPVYTLNNICSCGGLLDIFVFDGVGFVTQLTSLPTPQAPTPLNLIFSGPKQPRCFGDCDGSVNIFSSGGSPPYDITVLSSPSGTLVSTYTNIPAVTTTTVAGLCAGSFSFVVTDSKNCNRTFTTTLTQPTLVNPNATPTNITCNGVCNGSVTAIASGGVGPYTYSWASASSTPSTVITSTIGNLCPGVVTMTVTDSKTCTATYTTNITQPPAITLTVTKTNLNCGNVCNGTASVTATGGIGGFLYAWSPSGGSGAQATGLCAGDYTCTVTNNGNCVRTITVNIASPPALTVTPTQQNILCNSASTGSINLNPTGGTPNYTYSWSPNVSSTVTATGLTAGAYIYTVTDALGCRESNTITITQPPATSLTISNTSVTCNGACDGTATGNMSGGTLPYTYSWTPGALTTSVITTLCPNTYTLRVTDGNGCVITRTTSIIQPTPITVITTSVSPTCNGGCNGSINATPSGGTGPYTYTLQAPAGAPITSSPPFTNLCAGLYTLTVNDFRGCSVVRIINLTQPNPITLVLSSTPINCFNQCNATISSVINGGTPSYTVSWSAGGTGPSLTNQCVGVHTATVTDVQGCQATASVSITSPPDLAILITPTNPNCNAQCTGIATTSVSGGTPNYTINWNNGAVGNIINGLCQGTYTATVTDFFGCSKTQTVTITTPPAITLTVTNGTVSCAGSCDGTVSVTPTGGTSGYFYNWNSVPAQTTPIASGLCVGNYAVNVTDALGCIATIGANVAQPVTLTAFINNVQPSCNVCIGVATANGLGGTAPYTYSWSNGSTNQTANNLCVGVQTVIVTDAKGCTSTQTVQINQTVITLITTNGNTLSCNGGCAGVATANPAGGLPNYSYTWTPSTGPIQSTQTATGLCFGTHTVMVSDANGCSSTNTVSFTNPPAITLTVNQTNVSCNGACNGVATASALGGTGVINYLWQPGNLTSSSISNLCAGVYTVTATDANNCSQTQAVTITETSSLTASFTFTTPTTCTTLNGSIGAVINGGTMPYTFTWTPGNSTVNPLTNVGAGTYSLSIRDFAGCTQTIVTTLSNPTGPTVTVTSNSIACFGSCTGVATLTITGSGPFLVNGSAIPSSTITLSGLCAGITIPVITDANSCVTNQTISIVEPTQLIANGVVTNVSCNSVCNGSINLTPSGGTSPYSYTWLPSGGSGQDPTNLCAGNYSVIISDANACSTSHTFIVTQPTTLTLSFNKKDVLCNSNCTGGVRAVVGGGASPYTYTWTPFGAFSGSNIDTLVNLCSGDYTVIATDGNGCTITGTVNIGQPVSLTSTISSTNVKCNGQCNGFATINASGGTLPYTYDYNTTPITPTQTIGGLCVGTYTGNVTDANGCVSANSFNITEPLPIVITTTISNPKCNAICNGSVVTSVTGGNPNYNYNWIPNGGPVPSPTGLCAGNYTVIVTDDSLCTGQAFVVLTDPSLLISNISFTNSTCNSGCNGIATANPIGGVAPFSYSWATPVFTTQTISNLCAGSYTLTLTDANLCQDVQVVTLIDPPSIIVNPALTPATCGLSNGSINATASNGLAPYTYNWLAPVPGAQATNTLVTNLAAGVYTVIVNDAAGCSSTVSIALSNSNGPAGAVITSTNVTCQGQCNGSAEIAGPVVGGTAPYTLSWLNFAPNTLITNLCAGSYTAQIVDANNCLFFQSVAITQPQSIDDNEIIVSAACLGNCNGSISLNPSGGNVGAYTYSWSNSAATGTISNLCPGVYTATVTDVLGCTLVANYNLPGITTITSSTFVTNNTCFGACNGTALATNVAGGLPQYTFNWSDPTGQSTGLANSLCNGNYSVTITDANGCFNVIPVTISSPSQITFTPMVAQPNCGVCNGSAVVVPSGGTAGYTYIWSNGQTNSTASSLCAGVYDVQITDGNGCASTSSVIINNSSTITGEIISSANVSCGSTCDGTVTITAVGGVGAISYHWIHNNSSNQTLTGLCAGTYFCNMTDANGCSRTASVVIGATTNFTLIPQITQSSCSANTGSINVNVIGGTGSYNYIWIPAAVNSPSLTNLAPGSYTLTVSDGNCSQTQVYSINSVNGPIVTATQNNITCSGVCNGSISLTISGGNPTYATVWSNGVNSPSINGLCAGPYSYTVTDAAGCRAIRSFSLTTNTPIVFSTPDVDNPLCNNNCNGVITSIPSGGVLPFTYSWVVSTSTTSVANNLCSGNYSVIVSDANGCAATETYTLTGPTTISITAIVTDVNCNAGSDGAIDLTVTGGTPGPGYTYSWTPGGVTQDLSSLSAGTYTVVITDNNGCIVDSSFIVNEPNAIDDNEIIASAACFGNCNGSIQLNPIGGSGTYTYTWASGASTGTVTNLCPGPQTATITDSQGCTFIGNYNVPSLTTITASTIAVNNLCFNDCNGVLTATNIAGGVAPYTVVWNDFLGQPGNTAIGLCTGNYTATITDANGCFNQIPANVGSTSQVTFTPNITQPSCDLCNGVVAVSPVGGTAGYTYQWSNNQTTSTASNLCAGVYVLNITDANGCLTSTNVVVNSSSGITGETIVSTDLTCAGSCDGTINITAVGGVLPISYNWIHNNSSSQTVSNLCAGTYYCNMIDANGCSRTASIVIGATTSLTITSQVTQSSCSSATGSITVNVTGGTGVYSYAWLPVGTTPTLTNLAPGSYTLTVSDGNCSKTQIFIIQSINAPSIISTKKDISCNAICDGNLVLTISGGTPGYTTLWSNGATTTSISALCVGIYSVQVTDANGCSAVRSFTLNTVSPIIFSSPDLDNPQCHDDCNGSLTAIPIGGTMPYTFSWTPSNVTTATTNSLCTGNYSVVVTDINGCPASNTYSLINPPTLTLTAVITDASCNTAPDGSIDITVTGGVPTYNYNWSPTGSTSEDLINVLSGIHTLTLTDNFGCVIDTALTINSTLTVNAIAGNDTLFCQNGTLLLNGSNSSGGITYQWTEIPSGSTVSNTLIATVNPAVGTSTYVLTATNGLCIDKDTVVVTSQVSPSVDAGPLVSIPIFSSAGIGGNPTSATGVTFSWSPVTALDNPSATNPTSATTITTIYTVTVVDANGCFNSDTVTVFVYPEIKIPNGFSPNGDGKNDVWEIDFIYQFPNCEVEVYNRWGEQLFYSKGYAVPFNGQYKGKDLPVGTYYYVINLNHPAYPNAYTSPLTIFR